MNPQKIATLLSYRASLKLRIILCFMLFQRFKHDRLWFTSLFEHILGSLALLIHLHFYQCLIVNIVYSDLEISEIRKHNVGIKIPLSGMGMWAWIYIRFYITQMLICYNMRKCVFLKIWLYYILHKGSNVRNCQRIHRLGTINVCWCQSIWYTWS